LKKKEKRRGFSEKERGLGWGKMELWSFFKKIFTTAVPRGMPHRLQTLA